MACRRSVVSTARDQHRRLDRDFADAEARDGGADGTSDIARPRRWKTDTVSGGRNEPKVLLMTLSERVSGKGTRYFSGWPGKARLVGFLSNRALTKSPFGYQRTKSCRL
jgi:hypothetical protein